MTGKKEKKDIRRIWYNDQDWEKGTSSLGSGFVRRRDTIAIARKVTFWTTGIARSLLRLGALSAPVTLRKEGSQVSKEGYVNVENFLQSQNSCNISILGHSRERNGLHRHMYS